MLIKVAQVVFMVYIRPSVRLICVACELHRDPCGTCFWMFGCDMQYRNIPSCLILRIYYRLSSRSHWTNVFHYMQVLNRIISKGIAWAASKKLSVILTLMRVDIFPGIQISIKNLADHNILLICDLCREIYKTRLWSNDFYLWDQ